MKIMVNFLGYYEEMEYHFLICRGCDMATLVEKWTCTSVHDHNGDEIYSYNYHPKRKNLDEREIMDFTRFHRRLLSSYL
jgi:hypothetical protein